jgi:hypothetical protein
MKFRAFNIHFILVILSIFPLIAKGDKPRINDRFPIKGGSQLSPPIVYSPIHECAKAVFVYDFLPHALVRVYANGGELIGKKTPYFGFDNIDLTRALKVGDKITATQTVGAFASVPSYDYVEVEPFPITLNRPVVEPTLYACGQVVPVNQLVPSVHVSVFESGKSAPVGEAESPTTGQAVVTSSLDALKQVTAVQTACPLDPTKKIVSLPSDPVPVSDDPSPIPVPSIEQTYVKGSDSITVDGLLVGAAVQVIDGTNTIGGGLATASRNWVPVHPEIGDHSFPQAIQKLCRPSDPSPQPTQPPRSTLDALIVVPPVCAGSHFATIRNSVINANVVLLRNGQVAGYAGAVPGDLTSALGGGATWSAGDSVTAVQNIGSIWSPVSNTVVAGCSPSVVTHHNDNYRTGANLHEMILTPSRVANAGMRLKYTRPVNGPIEGQLLYVPALQGPGAVHNVVYVQSTANYVYAYDADVESLSGTSAGLLWVKHLTDPEDDPSGAMCAAPRRCMARSPSSTPVIDLATNTIYVLYSTKNQSQDTSGGTVSEQDLNSLDVAFWLMAIDIRTGAELRHVKVGGFVIRSDGTQVDFVAKNQWSRPALLLSRGSIYLSFGMRPKEELVEYHGWVLRYDVATFAAQGVFCTTPYAHSANSGMGGDNGEGAGIWQGGGGPAADEAGNIYFFTGNAKFDPTNSWFGDSIIKLSPAGNTLAFVGLFSPEDTAHDLENHDIDLGAGGPMLIPETDGLVGGGKTGIFYLLNRNTMTKVQEFQAFRNIYDPLQPTPYFGGWAGGPHLHGTPVYWRGHAPDFAYVYDWSEKDYLKAFKYYFKTGQFDVVHPIVGSVPTLHSPDPMKIDPMPGGMLSLSANGNNAGTGIIWAVLPASIDLTQPGGNFRGHVFAFDAESLKLLWDTSFPTNFPTLGKWLPPTIADGKLFIGTFDNQFIVYELNRTKSGRKASVPATPPQPAHRMQAHQGIPNYDEMESFFAQRADFQLRPPNGNTLLLTARAEGVQVYTCIAERDEQDSCRWILTGVEADLLPYKVPDLFEHASPTTSKNRTNRIGTQYGPSAWRANDGSSVSGNPQIRVAPPHASDLPWLLLEADSHEGKGMFSEVTYIQQLGTTGGMPPVNVGNASIGDETRVQFSASYAFYVSGSERK